MNSPTDVNCPTCKKTVPWTEDSQYRPFCSHRCQLIDLGEWASESYSIPISENTKDQDSWE